MTPQVTFVALLVLAAIAVAAVALGLTTAGTAWLMDRTAQSVDLPLTSDDVLLAVERRERRELVTFAAAAAVTCVIGALGALTPFGEDPLYFFSVAACCIAVTVIAGPVVAVGAQVFSPAPGARRVASASRRTVTDYIGRFRRAVAPVVVLACTAVVAIAVVRGTAPAVAVVVGVVALGGLVTQPWVDRAILRSPQPASDPLELAWDDAYRMRTLAGARASLANLAIFGAVLTLDIGGRPPTYLALAGVVVLSWIYSRMALPSRLLPRGLPSSATPATAP